MPTPNKICCLFLFPITDTLAIQWYFHLKSSKTIRFCTSTTAESRAKIWYQYTAFKPHGGLGCYPLEGGGSVVDSLLIVIPIVGFFYCSMLFGRYFCPFLFCNHLDGEERAGCFA